MKQTEDLIFTLWVMSNLILPEPSTEAHSLIYFNNPEGHSKYLPVFYKKV